MPIIEFIINTSLSFLIGKGLDVSFSKILEFIKNKRDEKVFENIFNETCEKYGLGNAFKEEYKDLVQKFFNSPTQFLDSLREILHKYNPSIDATKFIEELFLSLCNKLARHKDLELISIMLEYISYDELKKISKGFEDLTKLLSEYEAKRSSFDIGSLDDIAQKIAPKLKSYIDRTWLYYKQKYKEVIEYYNKVLEINPNDAGAWYNKGNAYYGMKNYAEAIKCYYIVVSLLIITQTDIELILVLLDEIIKNSEDNEDAIAIKTIILYLNNKYTKEECINILSKLKKSQRIEALINALNKKDTEINIKDKVDEAFKFLKDKVILKA